MKNKKIIPIISALLLSFSLTVVAFAGSAGQTPSDNGYGLVSNAAYYVSDEAEGATASPGNLDAHDFYKLANAIDRESQARNRDVGFLNQLQTVNQEDIYNAVQECDVQNAAGKAKLAQYLSGTLDELPNEEGTPITKKIPSVIYNTPANATDAQFQANMNTITQNVINYAQGMAPGTGNGSIVSTPATATIVIKAHFCTLDNNEDPVKTFNSWGEYMAYLESYITPDYKHHDGGCFIDGYHVHNDSCYTEREEVTYYEGSYIACPPGGCLGNPGQPCGGHKTGGFSSTRYYKELTCDSSEHNTWKRSCGCYPGQIISVEITYPRNY